MTGLSDLPVELLLEIHLLSLSSQLPLVSRSFHTLFSTVSSHHKARYLWYRHRDKKLLSHAIRYPICRLQVIHVLERFNREDQDRSIVVVGNDGQEKGKVKKKRSSGLKCPQLPRRLFKDLRKPDQIQPPTSTTSSSKTKNNHDNNNNTSSTTGGTIDLPLITYLLTTYKSCPNSHQGYPLARAVFAQHYPLVRLLLGHGADPGLKEGWAVVTAISNRDEELVKGLIERGYPIRGGESHEEEDAKRIEGDGEERDRRTYYDDDDGKKKNKTKRKVEESSPSNANKRIKLEGGDRCRANSEMLETAVKTKQWRLVDYLTAKGATPNLKVLKML